MADFFDIGSRKATSYTNKAADFLQQEKEKNEQQLENYNRYGVDATDQEYEIYNKVLDRYKTPEEKQNIAYRIGLAKRYQDMYGLEFQDAWNHVDDYNTALFNDTRDYKTAFEGVSDALTIGNNNIILGHLGNKLRAALMDNDTEKADLLWKKIQEYGSLNEALQDKAPANWFVEALEAGAQSLPFTAAVAGAGIFGNFIAPGSGNAAAMGVSSYLAAGQEYIDIKKNGGSDDAANLVSIGSGVLQGLIEADFGITNAITKQAAKTLGKEVTEDFLDKSLKKINEKLMKRFHFGVGRKMLLEGLEEYGRDLFSEGNEEFWQQIVSQIGQEIAASMDGYDLPDDDIKSISKELAEAWKGGVMGAFTLGLIPTGLKTWNSFKEYNDVKKAAQDIDSEFMFNEVVKDSPVFANFTSEEEKAEQMHNAYTTVKKQQERDNVARSAEEIKATNKAHEGYEEVVTDEEGEVIPQDVYREKDGSLYTNNVQYDDTTGSYRVGDATKAKQNNYGNIEYEINEETNTVTIKEFSMASQRENLRQEFYDDFAKEYAGWNIEWKDEKAAAIYDKLAEANPRGKMNGLNYYAYSEETNNNTRKYLLDQIDKYVPYKLNTNERTQLLGYVNTLSRTSNKVFTQLYEEMTGGRNAAGELNELFGNASQVENVLNKDQHTLLNKDGFIPSNGATLTQGMRSVIYVGKNGDFGTLLHEILHAASPYLSDDIQQQMENIAKKYNGNEEYWTRALEDYLVKGYTDNENVKPILDELSKIIVQFKHYLDDYAEINPEIQKVFDQLLEADDSVYSTAERAVAEYEQEQKAKQQAAAEEKIAGPTTETKVNTENTLLKKDKIEDHADEVKATLDDSAIPTSAAEYVSNIINDPASTHQEKAAAEQWAADADIDTNTAIYQVLHAAAIEKLAELNIAIDINESIKKAKEMEEKYSKQLTQDPAWTRKKIKKTTHCEKINGEWIYETDENLKEIHLNNGISSKTLEYEVKNKPDNLVYRSQKNDFVFGDVVTDETVYKIWPSIAKITFRFYNDLDTPKINIGHTGIGINLRRLSELEKTEKGLKSVLATLMQYCIQEKEGINFNETLELKEAAAKEYNDLKRLSLQAAVNKLLHRQVDLGAFRKAYENISEDVKSMEALNVASRIMKDANNETTYFADDLIETKKNFKADIDKTIDQLVNPTKISHQESIRSLRDKYEGTERWLKAPNGKDTNLTEEQWLVVRTPQFKKWFGDWENYPETASKVVDENGEPKVVYHGSRNKRKFTEFDANMGFNINAIYFASDNGVAAHFSGTGENVRFDKSLFQKIENLNTAEELIDFYNKEFEHKAVLKHSYTTKKEAKEYGVKAGNFYGIDDNFDWSPLGNEEVYVENLRRMVNKEAERALYGSEWTNGFTYACFLNVKNPEVVDAKGKPYWNVFHNGNYSNTESIAAAVDRNNIDGVIVNNVKETDYENILTDDYIVFDSTQIKSATDNNGDFDINNADIRYQTTEEEDKRAYDFLHNSNKFDEKEQKRIEGNLNKYKGTGWRDLVIHCLNVRADMDLLMQGKDIPENSLFNSEKCENYKKIVTQMKEYLEYMKEHPEEKNRKYKKFGDKLMSPIHNYFFASSTLIGGGGETKALYNVAGSFVNCDPSKDCVNYCYAVKGRSGMANMVINRELVNWCIESDPEMAAFIIASQYSSCGEVAKHHLALRLLDTGDMSEKWLPMIRILNEKGISCSIFSKRPEILKQVDPHKNVILLSLDQSNVEMGKLYPTLPKAYVYSGTQFDNQWLAEHEEEIKRQGGVILFNSEAKDFPMKTVNRTVKKGKGYIYKPVKTIDYNAIDIPKWTISYTCPINAGWKQMGNAAAVATFKHWNCAECDKNGQGCSFARDAEQRKQFFATFSEIPQETINETFRLENEYLRIKLKQEGITNSGIIESIINELGLIRTKNLAEYDEGRTNAVSGGTSEGNSDSNTNTAGRSDNSSIDIKHQETEKNKLDIEYTKAVNEGNFEKARAMLNQKASEALQAGATFTYKDDEGTVAYKLHRGRVPHGSYDYKKEGPLTLDKILEHNKQHDEIRKWNKEHPEQKKPVPTLFVYKTLGFDREGGSHATYAGTADQLPWESWLVAQAIKPMQSPVNGGWYIPGDTGINNTDVGIPGPKEGGASKLLSFRPAFHSGRGAYPGQMRVIYKTAIDEYNKLHKDSPITPDPVKYADRKTKGYMLPSKLLAVVEIPGENDFQETAERYAAALAERTNKWYDEHPEQKRPKNINPRAQLPYTPDMGYYTYNNQGEEWVLAGQWKQHRLLTLDEIRKINEADGILNDGETLLDWPAGYNPEDYGFNADGTKKLPEQIKIADITYDDEGNVIPLSERFNVENADIRYQTAYHGTGVDFEKFDTERYGLSGEGSMSFGYGLYLTGSEEIARDYGERQRPYTKNKELDQDSVEGLANYIALFYAHNKTQSIPEMINKEISHARRTYEQAKESYPSLLPTAEHRLKIAESVTEEDVKKELQAVLYSVDIPDEGFLQWDAYVDYDLLQKIKDNLYNYLIENDKEESYAGTAAEDLKKELDYILGTSQLYGQQLYGTITDYLGSEKAASKFLYNAGVIGMEYPAYTNFGTADGKEARNFVIYNDDDAVIFDKILYQTRDDLMEDARKFDTWQDFMEEYEMQVALNMEGPEAYSQVPAAADAQWYQSTWEMAKGLKTEESLNEEEVKEKYKRDPQEQTALDAMFTTTMASDPEMLNNFLIRVAEIEAVDLESPEYAQAADEEDAAERRRIELLQDFIGTQLSHGNWLSNAQRVRRGDELTTGARNRILGLMRSNPRSYRAIYSEIMEDPSYAVPEEDTMGKQLAGKLKRYKLVNPEEDIERINPERMKKLADLISNIEVQQQIKNGTMKMDDSLTAYIASINKELRDAEKEYNALEKETQSDYQRIADQETRDLLKLQQSLIKARAELDKNNKETQRLLNKGLKISSKYNKTAQNLKANYDEIFRKFKDLEAVVRIDATVQAALDRQRKLGELRGRIDQKKVEADTVAEVQKLRVQLVKRVMRRVPFEKIDYENARKLIVLQRMFEPNLMGDINRWLYSGGVIVRNVVANILTDDDYKQQVMSYLKSAKPTEGRVNFIKLLNETKSIDQFDKWTEKDKKAALRYLPKENWIKELNLKKLAEEREQSIDLDIGLKEKHIVMKDKDGHTIIDQESGQPRLMSAWEVEASKELQDLLHDTVGDDMYHNIMHRPFAEWTTDEMIRLATLVNNLYVEGRDQLSAKKQQQIEEAAAIRKLIDSAVKNTGIVINDDDDDATKERKQKKINKILGLDTEGLKGTEAGKTSGIRAKMNRLLHGYNTANVRRVARLLDNQGEGVNTSELFWKENEAYTSKENSITRRVAGIQHYMAINNVTMEELAKVVKVGELEFTVDELLYFLAANEDYAVDEVKVAKNVRDNNPDGDVNDDYAATARNAVMFGSMYSRNADQAQKEAWAREDEDMQRRIEENDLTTEEKQAQTLGMLISKPGTAKYIDACRSRFDAVIAEAKKLDPKFLGLLDVIQEDYAEQYERMNEASIKEFNIPVGRVNNYVPLVRLESNGDTNYNQVKEDLLATMGGNAGKQWVNKGMTKRRVAMSPLHQKPVQIGLYKTWSNSVERTEHFIAYAPYVRELNRIYKSRDAEYTRRFIENRYGKDMLSYIDDYINEVANPNANKVRNAGDELLRTLRGKTAPAYLAWKASAIIKQGATSPWPYMQFVNPKDYLAASWKCITSRGAMYDAIREKSVFMAKRVMDPMNDLIDEMAETSKGKWDRGLAKFNKKGMAGLEWIDWVCVAPGWLACYEKKYAEVNANNESLYLAEKARLEEENGNIPFNSPSYMSMDLIESEARKAMLDPEVEAVNYADDCTRLCQPSSRSVDISPLFKNSSEAMKAYLQFQTSLNVIWQNIRFDLPYYAANLKNDNTPAAVKKQIFFRMTGTILGYVLAGIFMNSIMEGYSGGDDDDKDKLQALREAVYYSVTQFTDAVPMVGSAITNAAEKVITGKSTYTTGGTDMTPMFSKVLNTVKAAAGGKWAKAAEQTAEGFAMSLGLPVSGSKEILKEAGINVGNLDFKPGIELNEVYGILNNITPEKEDK